MIFMTRLNCCKDLENALCLYYKLSLHNHNSGTCWKERDLGLMFKEKGLKVSSGA